MRGPTCQGLVLEAEAGMRGSDVLPKMTIVMKMMKKMVINTAKILNIMMMMMMHCGRV